jgi:hypothetical protein
MQLNEKVYAKFTPAERVALLVEAAIRNDKAESDLLWHTAPRVHILGIDPQVSYKWDSLHSFTSAVVIMLQGLISCVYAAFAVKMIRDSYHEGWLTAGGNPEAITQRASSLKADTDRLKARAVELLSCVAAVDALCEEIGYRREQLITAFVSHAHAEQIENDIACVAQFADAIDPDLEAEFLSGFRSRYDDLFRSGHEA